MVPSPEHPSTGANVPAPGPAHLVPPAWTALPRTALPLLLGVALAYFIHLLAPELGGFSSLVAFAGINVVLAVSLNVVNGYAGQFSIGHAGFMAVGGYLGGAVVYYGSFRIWGDAGFHGGTLSWTGREGGFDGPPLGPGDLLFLGGCAVGGLVAAAAGWVVGLPSLRLRGDYLAIVTLGFGEIVRVVLEGTDRQLRPSYSNPGDLRLITDAPWPRLLYHLGGAQSFSGLPGYATPFWVFVWVAITLLVAYRLKYAGYGRALLSIREDEVAARSVGVDVTKYNVRAFMIAAFFAGVGGVLTALNVGQIKAGELGFQRSFDLLIMVVLGGLGSISGAVIAAVLLTCLSEVLKVPPSLVPWGLPVLAAVAGLLWLRARRPGRAVAVLLAVAAAYQAGVWAAAAYGVKLDKARMILYALSLIVIMVVRPQGLLGVHEIWEVWPLNRLLAWDRFPLARVAWARRGWRRLTGTADGLGPAGVTGPAAPAGGRP